MPIYEYECTSCKRRTEAFQKVSDPPLATCPECGGALKRLLSPPAVQFKGSGWYVTDYASKGSPKKEEGEKKGEEKGAKAEEGGKTEGAKKTSSAADPAT